MTSYPSIPLPPSPTNVDKKSSPNGSANIISYDSFAGLRGDRIPPHVKDSREMVDAVAAWALPGTLSHIPADVLLAVVGGLMCEYQVRCAAGHHLHCVTPPVVSSGSFSMNALAIKK